ncbi:MAG: alkyl hydroperoxide reductase / thiol specific antioxidant / Mal allergen [Frankiales bacterium]|jgi:sugar lactone lactonase YvrE|nr:alkyl hydroperoxide reductase / thiol specific antioxidant / Mal allergen [Frankiales bacterium]
MLDRIRPGGQEVRQTVRVTTAKRQARVRAPQLHGAGGWINTGGRSYGIEDFRGRVLLLDFWTFCCVNCLHVLDELRPLEERFADVLVVVGVHSPKFAHEAEHDAVLAAVERYEVHHPVLDDPELATWSQYAVRAWPTLCVVDPEGYLVHVASGEGHAEGLTRVIENLVEVHAERGTLRRGSGPYVAPPPADTALRFPGKVLLLPDGDLLVTDTAHHSIVRLAPDGETVLQRYGTGERGLLDGPAPRFAEPQGLCLLDDGTVLVADTANHCLRTLDLATGSVATVAGTGQQWRPGDATCGPAREVRLSTPWDVCGYEGRVVVAMAGTHQLWTYDGSSVSVLAGTTGEGLRDGAAQQAYLAQPSGLAAGADRLWFADAETSALRWYRDGQIGTAVGTGLFDFGHRDGPAGSPDQPALLQHPLGVAVLPDGSVAVCDTYNDAIRRYDPLTGEVTTLATDVREPSGAVVVDGDLVVVASAAHRLERPVAPGAMRRVQGAAQRTQRPATAVLPGAVELEVVFEPPAGQHLDERYGPATRLVVSASPEGLLLSGGGASTGLTRSLVLADGIADGVLHVAATAASCDDVGEHPACHLTQQDWGIPVRMTADGAPRLGLVLRGLDA